MSDNHSATTQIVQSLRSLLQVREVSPTREELAEAAQQLMKVVPYNYDAWRLHADLLINALKQLETRQIQPDANFELLTIPLREDDLRKASEAALRQCAHYAPSNETKIALVDEANRIRTTTWF